MLEMEYAVCWRLGRWVLMECVGGAGDGFGECWRFGEKGIC